MTRGLVNLSRVNLQMRRSGVVFGEVEYAPGGVCGPRRQEDYQVVIVGEGRLDLTIDRLAITLGPGQAVLLCPGHREHFQFDPQNLTRHTWCAVAARALPVELRRALPAAAGRALAWTPHLQRLWEFGRACGSFAAEDEGLERQRFLHLGRALLAEFAVEAARQSGVAADQRIERMRRLIVADFRRPLQLADLARAAGLSKQHLLKVCRAAGIPPPLEQLYEQRLGAAADLLLHSGLSVKEVAAQSGFADPYHFSRKFRSWSGVSPRAYRLHLPG